MAEQVFVSYASQDRGRVQKVLKALRSRGLFDDPSTVTIDASSVMIPGSSIRGALRKAIESANNVIVLWTPQAARSEWVNYELGMATAFGKPITLVMSDEAAPDVPPNLGDMQVVKL
ncbi:MAG: toll/interleukin-1 receptor domain-containing protein [Gammaproteobacteria bacterium]